MHAAILLAIYLVIAAAPVLGPLAHAVDHLRGPAAPGPRHASEHHHPHHHHHHDDAEHAHAPLVLALLGAGPAFGAADDESGPVRLVIVTIPNHLGATAAGAPAPAAPVGRLRAAGPSPGDDRARTPLTPPPRPDHG